MPIYNYHCGECGKTEEYLLSMGDSPSKCAYCASPDMTRVRDGETFSAHSSSSKPSDSDRPRASAGINIIIAGVSSVLVRKLDPRSN